MQLHFNNISAPSSQRPHLYTRSMLLRISPQKTAILVFHEKQLHIETMYIYLLLRLYSRNLRNRMYDYSNNFLSKVKLDQHFRVWLLVYRWTMKGKRICITKRAHGNYVSPQHLGVLCVNSSASGVLLLTHVA